MKYILGFMTVLFLIVAIAFVSIFSTVRHSNIEWCEARNGTLVTAGMVATCHYDVYIGELRAG